MKLNAVHWTLFALASLGLFAANVQAQEDAEEEQEERVVWRYRIQKRGGGGGQFTGWFLDVNTSAEPEEGKAANLISAWHGQSDTAKWEIRPAGQFNGVDSYYIVNLSDGDYGGWFLGINTRDGSVGLHETARSSTTKWFLRWAGQSDKWDIYQIQNVGLTRFKGAYVGLNDQAQTEGGIASNIELRADGADPHTFWRLERLPLEDAGEARRPPSRYGSLAE